MFAGQGLAQQPPLETAGGDQQPGQKGHPANAVAQPQTADTGVEGSDAVAFLPGQNQVAGGILGPGRDFPVQLQKIPVELRFQLDVADGSFRRDAVYKGVAHGVQAVVAQHTVQVGSAGDRGTQPQVAAGPGEEFPARLGVEPATRIVFGEGVIVEEDVGSVKSYIIGPGAGPEKSVKVCRKLRFHQLSEPVVGVVGRHFITSWDSNSILHDDGHEDQNYFVDGRTFLSRMPLFFSGGSCYNVSGYTNYPDKRKG